MNRKNYLGRAAEPEGRQSQDTTGATPSPTPRPAVLPPVELPPPPSKPRCHSLPSSFPAVIH
ncbi:hypothetical protein E2C01_100961 [Portunus trituberculatus]|uniref:Uncharacterized protein n=1 Tax=Portunus trituberculatus TaxID=210409 RepID=A0A5B7KDI5_PORTR|nr:hypothetical protein [Portunus trituberculatus]